MFDIPDRTTGNVAESKMVGLSKSEGLEYTKEVFLFGLATFACGKIGVQGVRCFGKRVLMLRVVITHIAKSQLQGSCSRLRRVVVGYFPRIGFHKIRNRQVHLQLVLVQKRTRLEFLRRKVGRLYTWESPNTVKRNQTQVQRDASSLSKYSYKKGDSHQEVSGRR